MTSSSMDPARRAVATVLEEILNGASPESGWLLNPGDAGLLRSLDALTAEQASAAPVGGGAPIAAHVEHLRYGLELLVRWSRGEDGFDDADYSASWELRSVSEAEWAALRAALRGVAEEWRGTLARALETREDGLTAAVAIAAHLAYHLGAIRQIDRAARGPAARD